MDLTRVFLEEVVATQRPELPEPEQGGLVDHVLKVITEYPRPVTVPRRPAVPAASEYWLP